MNKLRKFTALLLAVLMTLTVYIPNVSAETDDEYVQHIQAILQGIGILQFDITDMDANITRGQFVDMAARAYFEDISQAEGSGSFNDVLPTHEFRDSIEMAYMGRLIQGNDEGMFEPEKSITLKEALTIILRMLNYEQYLTWRGGMDSNCMSMAAEIGLLKGVERSETEISARTALRLMYNAAKTPMLEFSTISGNNIEYTKDNNTTLISERIKVYKDTGLLTENHTVSLSGTPTVSKGNVVIDGLSYSAGKTSAEDFIGMNVTFYYKNDEGGEMPTILYIEDNNSDFTVINEKEYDSCSNGVIRYLKNGTSQKKVTFDKTAIIVLNGSLVKADDYDDSIFDIDMGTITVIKNSYQGHTAVIIKSYHDMVFDRVAESDGKYILIDKFDSDNNIVYTDEKDDLNIYRSDGTACSISDIESGSVLSAAMNIDKTQGTIIVHKEVLTQALVTKSSSDEVTLKTYNTETHTYDEKIYEYCNSFEEKNKSDKIVQPSSEYTVYIDAFGYVAYAKSETDISDFYAYIIKSGVKEDAEPYTMFLKIMHDDGRVMKHDLAEKVTIDGKKYKENDIDGINAALNLSQKGRIAYISLNYESQITDIDLCPDETDEREGNYSLYKDDREDDDTLYKVGGKTMQYTPNIKGTRYYYSGPKAFDGGIYATNDTKVLCIPLDSDDESRYMVSTLNLFKNDRYYNVSGYSRNDDKISTDVIVYYYYSRYSDDINEADDGSASGRKYARLPFGKSFDNERAFVNKVKEAVSEEGDTGWLLEMTDIRTAKDVEYFVEDFSLIDGIEKGDIIRYFGIGTELMYVEKLYSMETKTINETARTIAWNSGAPYIKSFFLDDDGSTISDNYGDRAVQNPAFELTHCYITKKDDSLLAYVPYSYYSQGKTETKYEKTRVYSQAVIYRYNKRSTSIEKISADELLAFSDSPVYNSEAVIVCSSASAVAIIIY